MKNIGLIFFLAVGLLSMSCNNDDAVELFTVTHISEFEVPAGLNTVETHFFIQPATNSPYDDLLESTGFEDASVGGITPKFCELTTAFGDIDLDFVRLVEIRVLDPFDPEYIREVFYLDPVPGNSRGTLRPFPGLLNVKEIIGQPTYGVEVRIIFRLPPPTTMRMRLLMEFSAVAK